MPATTSHSQTDNAFLKGLEYTTKWDLAELGDITYAFAGSGDQAAVDAHISGSGRSGTFSAVTATLSARIETALQSFSDIADVTFTEVTDFDTANFKFGSATSYASSSGGLNGSMEFPEDDAESFFIFDNSTNMTRAPETGAGAPLTRLALHEIGHGMSLTHPHEPVNNPWTGAGNTDAADSELDNSRYTLMSYERGGLNVRNDTRDHGYNVTLAALDIAALQAMYGANTSTHTGATTYSLTDTGNAALDLEGADGSISIGRAFYTIWDNQQADARDKIDYSGTKQVLINLNDATLTQTVDDQDRAWIDDLATSTVVTEMSTEMKFDFFDSALKASAAYHAGGFFSRVFNDATAGDVNLGGYSIANGVVIEDAEGGDQRDILIGNQVANVIDGNGGDDFIHGAAGDDTIDGGAGNDEIWGGAGNDTIDGGAGDADVAAYSGLCVEYSVEQNDDGTFSVTHLTDGADGVDLLTNIEKLRFEDGDIDLADGPPYGCPPVDFIFLVDLSGSYSDDLANFVSNARNIANSVREISPDSQFAVASFIDKPTSPYGSPGDYLYRADLSLTDSIGDFESALSSLSTLSGGDYPEAHYVGLWRAANGVGLNLREGTRKIILTATDAPPHAAADYGLNEDTIREFLDNEGIETAVDTSEVPGGGEPAASSDGEPVGDPVDPDDIGLGLPGDLPESGTELFLETVAARFGRGAIAPIFAVTGGVEDEYEGIADAFRSASVVPISSSSDDISDAVRQALIELTSPAAEIGSDDANLFEGTPENDVYAGGRGDDTISGEAGDDTLDGGGDNDVISGGAGNDALRGGTGDDEIDGGAGDDTVEPGSGIDMITLGAGADVIVGTLADINGDTVTDVMSDDSLLVLGGGFTRSGLTVTDTGLMIDGDGDGNPDATITGVGVSIDGEGDLMAARTDAGTLVSFESFLAGLQEGASVDDAVVNGIINADFLDGHNADGMSVTFEAEAKAAFDNTVGYYEVDASGNIVSATVLASNVKTASDPIDINVSDPANQIGFFLVQDGANKIGASEFSADEFDFVSDGSGGFDLTSQGSVLSGVEVFFSHDASLNSDGQEHVLSGVSDDGRGALRIGFEDLLRDGKSDDDFQDVILYIDIA